MTREEKQKAIDALKISAPVMVMTQEEFNDYIQTLNKIMNWLEQEPVIDKIRAEITARDSVIKAIRSDDCCFFTAEEILELIDKAESEE